MRYLIVFTLLLAAVANVSNADPVINEFCASNQSGLQDADGDRSDWVEIYNPDSVSADLTDWYLTDSAAAKTKWRFPAVSIPAKGYLVVFASGKDRHVAGQPLHTNFSLGAGGEYLGLILPDGQTAVSEFNPSFPAQFSDLSYGTPTNEAPVTFAAEGGTANWIVPTSASSPASTWTQTGFNAAGWNSTPLGIGYDTNIGNGQVNYLPQVGSGGNTQSLMQNINTSCYLRVPFTVAAGTQAVSLKLRLKYDDGFIAWLNGQPLMSAGTQLRRNSPVSPAWNSISTSSHTDSASIVFEDFDVSESIGLLVEGPNVLCIQGLNQSNGSSDFLLRPELSGTVATGGGTLPPGYFATPTPGAKNSGTSGMVVPQEVSFSRADGTFTSNFNLSLGGALGDQQIRYTIDGSTPTAASTLYSGAFTVSTSTIVRARIYAPATGALGFIGARHFEFLGTTISNYNSSGQFFKSALPIVVLNNRGGGEIGDTPENVRVQIYDRDASGYASLATTAVPQTFNASINIRGRSSAGFPKKSYGVEVHDENENGKDLSILGMPAGEDWALIGCYEYDRAFSRNSWIYEMSRQAGRWSSRTRLVEVYFNQDGNQLSYLNSDYRGVYILCETIRRGEDRVDIDDLQKGETTYPGVSGGFIFKVDSPEGDEFAWKTNRDLPPAGTGGDNLVIHRPKLADLATQQSTYMRNYFQSFEDALYTEAGTNFSTRTYRNYIDSAAWADHNIFNALAKNVDALRLSAYFYKDRAGKMAAGPLWDFDRSVNSTDGRDNDTNTWVGTGDATNYFTFAWWDKLFADVEFRQVYVDRWQKLRKGPLGTSNVNSVFDGYLAEFKPADADNPAARDYTRWYSAGSNNISTEINNMKSWLSTRSGWIDSQFAQQPNIVRPSGEVAAGLTTAIGVPGGTTVYYTTDGSDPRAEGGSPSATAQTYTGTPVTISATMKLTARAFRAGSYTLPATNWSGPVEALYLVNETYATPATLAISGINYNPLGPDTAEAAAMPEVEASDFEWIELKNISAAPINLDGVSLAQDAPVSAVTLAPFTLAPGARAVVARNAAAFTLRYGSAAAARIAGTWSGDGSLDNAGDAILLEDRFGGVVAEFAYDDSGDWPERADGKGSALEFTAEGPYEDAFAWRASRAVNGDPGITQAAASVDVTVNEIRANTVLPARDAIELYNGGAAPVNLGGWFLSTASVVETAADYRTFRIPNGTVIPAGGHVVFQDTVFSPANEMPLDGNRGGSLHLVSANPSTAKLLNFESEVEFTPMLAGVSYGAYPDGSDNYVPLAAYTPAAANSDPRVGPVQVTEIHYHPAGSTPEFVELTNTGSSVDNLGKWTLRGDVDYDFAASYPIASGESIVLVSFDPVLLPAQATAFRSQYAVPAGVRLVGPWSAGNTLGNSGGTVRLRRLVPPPAEEPGYIGLMVEDEVNYLANSPWPTTASGTGSAIRRLGIYYQGSDPTAWAASAASPGTGASGYAAWKFENFPTSGGAKTDDPDGDGLPNFAEYLLGSLPGAFTATATSVDPNGGEPRFVLDYTIRKDRDDGSLSVLQSSGLQLWIPAEHDEFISTDGITENRRAWLPVEARGFLRLNTQEIPPSP